MAADNANGINIMAQGHAEKRQKGDMLVNNMVLLKPLLLLVALADFASLALTQPFEPISAPSLVRKSDASYNAPNSQAGT